MAAIALGIDPPPARYALRGGDPVALVAQAEALGLRRVSPAAAAPGDAAMVLAGPAQIHLVVLSETGFIHADAWLGRVTEVPGRLGWPVVAAWRADERETGEVCDGDAGADECGHDAGRPGGRAGGRGTRPAG